MKNAIGREIPMELAYLKGRELYAGEFAALRRKVIDRVK